MVLFSSGFAVVVGAPMCVAWTGSWPEMPLEPGKMFVLGVLSGLLGCSLMALADGIARGVASNPSSYATPTSGSSESEEAE